MHTYNLSCASVSAHDSIYVSTCTPRMQHRCGRVSMPASASVGVVLTALLLLCSGAGNAATISTPSGNITLPDAWLYSEARGMVNVIQSAGVNAPYVEYTLDSPTASDLVSSDTTSPASVSNNYSLGYAVGYSATATTNYGTNSAIATTGPCVGVAGQCTSVPSDVERTSVLDMQPGDLVAFAEGNSSWGDGFVITGGTGTGTATVNVRVSGTLFSGNIGGAYGASYRLDYYDSVCFAHPDGCPTVMAWDNDPQSGASLTYLKPRAITEIVNLDFTPTFDFVYDQPFALETYLTVASSYSGSADFSHTAGVLSFDLPAGATLYSASGTFDTALVPLPSALPLILSGLAGIRLIGRLRKTG